MASELVITYISDELLVLNCHTLNAHLFLTSIWRNWKISMEKLNSHFQGKSTNSTMLKL